jgi:2-keto-4-pentenoate hydratase/2-oxohepta-3-ene-1,7-dioic acid hydratase in catechol pathway
MKLLRYGPAGREKPGLLDADGRIRDLSSIVSHIDSGLLAPARLEHLSRFDPVKLPLVRGAPRLGVPYTGIGKFIGIGLNYSDHAAEAGMEVPSEPIVFLKATTSITGPNDGIVLPKGSTKVDWKSSSAW